MELLTNVNKNEVLKYLGYRGGEKDGNVMAKIDEMAKLVIDAARPQACHMVLKIISHEPLETERLGGVFTGEDIKRHLKECSECVLMAATLGSETEKLLRRLSVTDMADAVIFDACASSAIENVCDNYTREIEEEYRKKNMFLTERFSPGYGDLPLETQRFVTDALQTEKRIGLCLNRSMMMQPSKSVTAIIGASDVPQAKRKTPCESCVKFEDCEFRKRGVVCYE
ncbi:MAG: hypothetical protein LUG52_10050 [Clostridia bacterium]|nr:hypothetical protein [Clostridia bacterium]